MSDENSAKQEVQVQEEEVASPTSSQTTSPKIKPADPSSVLNDTMEEETVQVQEETKSEEVKEVETGEAEVATETGEEAKVDDEVEKVVEKTEENKEEKSEEKSEDQIEETPARKEDEAETAEDKVDE